MESEGEMGNFAQTDKFTRQNFYLVTEWREKKNEIL